MKVSKIAVIYNGEITRTKNVSNREPEVRKEREKPILTRETFGDAKSCDF